MAPTKFRTRDEFEEAVQNGAIDAELEGKALEVLKALIAEVEAGQVERRLQEVMRSAGFPDLQAYIRR